MVGLSTRTDPPARRDPVTRTAALWATAVAVPVALLAGWLLLSSATGRPAAAPSPSATPGVRSTAPVAMPAPTLAGAAAGVCRTLLVNLPGQLRDLPRRRVGAGPEQNAAYGDPPVTVACGSAPAVVRPTDLLFVANGICWHTLQVDGAAVLTTVDRTVPVRVTVPAPYGQPVQWANGFAAAVTGAVPRSTAAVPTGCAE